jgi:hypothetical protein
MIVKTLWAKSKLQIRHWIRSGLESNIYQGSGANLVQDLSQSSDQCPRLGSGTGSGLELGFHGSKLGPVFNP